jgi:hypothetical protein
MLWVVVVVAVLAVAGALAVVGLRIGRRSDIGEVVPGRFAAMATTALRPAPELLDGVSALRDSTGDAVEFKAETRPSAVRRSGESGRTAAGRTALGDAVVPGVIAAGVGAYEWLTPNQSVLDAMHALTHDQVSNSLDLWSGVQDNGTC